MDIKSHQLFSPFQIGKYELQNRLVVAPMSRVSATATGEATDEMANYYSAFARGGFSMIITEGNYIDAGHSKAYSNQPGLTNSQQSKAWKKVVDAVKPSPALIVAQLMHAGAISQLLDQTLAPSAVQPAGIKLPHFGGTGPFPLPQTMTIEQIEAVKQSFVDAAKYAQEAGFNGIELHAANGYLLDQFLTSELNTREDQYGGSIENRFRLIAEITGSIRQSLPADLLIGIRLSEGKVNDLLYRWPAGTSAAVELMEQVKAAGFDFVHIAVQTGEWERDSFYADGSSMASQAKKITGLPVIANGGMHSLERAERAFAEHQADLLSIGKAALADPNWPRHMMDQTIPTEFHRDMLWPSASISRTREYMEEIKNNQSVS